MSDSSEITVVSVPLYDPENGPNMWAECTECGLAYTLHRGFRWTDSSVVWVWRPDCKCGKRKKPAPAPARLVNANGEVKAQ